MTTPLDPLPTPCKVCGHTARHQRTNVTYCAECKGPCMTEEARAEQESYPKPWDRRKR